jgi:hypothetical protein
VKYSGRVQYKLKYEGVEVRKKLVEIRPAEQQEQTSETTATTT